MNEEEIAKVLKENHGFKHIKHVDYGDGFINDKNKVLVFVIAPYLYAEHLPWDKRILECVKNGKKHDPNSWGNDDCS